MAQKVSCEIRTITEREGRDGKFFSLNIADSGAEGYARIPDAQFRSYSIPNEAGWNKLKAAIEKALKAYDAKSSLNEKMSTGAKPAKYWSTKAKDDKHVSAVIIVDIELADGFNLAPQYDSGLKAMTVKLSGKLLTSTVRVRAPRPGNSVE